MLNMVLFPSFIVALFFLSHHLSKTLSQVFYTLTRNHKLTITFLALLFLPGVVVHELSHLLTANLLFVKTGEVEFFPQVEGNNVKLGSVAVAKTDLFRRFLIGGAPLFGGSLLLVLCMWYLQPFSSGFSWKWVLFGYILFEIGNTMFSSRKDMEGGGFLLAIVFLAVAFFIPIIRQNIFMFLLSPAAQVILMQLNKLLLLIITVDIAIYGFARIVLHRKG